jgi:FO synthase
MAGTDARRGIHCGAFRQRHSGSAALSIAAAMIAPRSAFADLFERALSGLLPSAFEARSLAVCSDLPLLGRTAAAIRDRVDDDVLTFSRKIFLPLTQLCRDSCHYCTFARAPRHGEPVYLRPDQILALARAGERAGCQEALFTLGDKPELRYRAARRELDLLGYPTTLAYLAAMARLVRDETGLLPHLNPGAMTGEEIAALRPVCVSMGIMLETTAARLGQRGGPHFGSPDKIPAVRLATIEAAGQARVPLTTGLLIGIGETRAERIEALLALRDRHDAYGHIQEIIIQNFKPKPGTRMATAAEPSLHEHLWTISVARILFGPHMSIQAPPNLRIGGLADVIAAGISDFGGISPVTPDHVNPEAPWPELDALRNDVAAAGKLLTERLAIYPAFLAEPQRWLDEAIEAKALRLSDSQHLAKVGGWTAGKSGPIEGLEAAVSTLRATPAREKLAGILRRIGQAALTREEIIRLFAVRGADFWRVCEAADRLREESCGTTVGYVVNRNINYTNICSYRCQFCAFSKGKKSENLRGVPYRLELDDIAARVREAWLRGATEVCLQGGIHPDYTGDTYLAVLRTVKRAAPEIHVHAFSPLEVFQGAATLGLSVEAFLQRLQGEGLGSLPGTAAEILTDRVRALICPDKLSSAQWLSVVATAHKIGLATTATIMFGHLDHPIDWAEHLILLRDLQQRTGGLTEFVPLPFVPMETPLYRKGRARQGPTLREAILMHAVARLVLHPWVRNIQTSWVKMGVSGAELCLKAGANDLGGTLMDESISRAAGASHGQEMLPQRMERLISAMGRTPHPRTTLYAKAPAERMRQARAAPPLHPAGSASPI